MTPEEIKTARQEQHKLDVLLSDYQEYGLNDELAGDIFDAACNIKDYLTMALKAIEAHQAELDRVKQETLLEAARAVCLMCKLNKTKVRIWRGYYRHIDNNGRVTLDCDADSIYQILAADQGESEVNS
jgi:hypothetical protein